MFEIHYHLLFGVDDGPETIEASLELAEASVDEGVTHLVCTPHANAHHTFDPEINGKKLAMLNESLSGRITLGMGCDFHLSSENIEDLHRNPAKYTINGKQYLLVEFPNRNISSGLDEVLRTMLAAGIVPIVTHPERNPTLRADPRRMKQWVRDGCLVQITAGSLTGRFGPDAEAMCSDLIKGNWVHFVASDAHHIERRPPCMRAAYDLLQDRFGQETADRLCLHNPKAAFLGEKLRPQPEAIEARGFLRRLFRIS